MKSRAAVVVALILAFAAGWFGRGCGQDRSPAPVVSMPPQRAARTPARAESAAPPSRDVPRPAPGSTAAPPSDRAPPPPARPAPGAATEPKAKDDKDARQVTGVVVDSLSGAPVAGVRILLCGPSGWHGGGTDAEGRFACDLEPDWDVKEDRIEVRAGRDGYRTTRVPVATAEVRVEIERRTTAPKLGRVVGRALGEDGKPLTGRIFICLRDDLDFRSPGIWTIADANGRFAIEGIDPGHWTAQLSESEGRFDVNVPEGGEASIELRADFGGRATGAFAGGELTQAAYAAQEARLDRMMMWAAGSEEAARAVGWGKQQLGYQWLRVAPGRDVVVAGAPNDPGAFIRLDRREGGCCEWRAAIADGTARFPSIPLGKWRAVLVRAGEPETGVDVEVVKGDGALTVEMSGAK